MSYRPLTYFTALSLAAHAAMFGLWGHSNQVPPRHESSIEIGMVSLPKIENDFARNRTQSPAQKSTPSAKIANPEPDSAELTKPITASVVRKPEKRDIPEAENLSREGVAPQFHENSPESAPATATEAAPLQSINPAPDYPAAALRYGWEGEVWLKVDVDRYGTVRQITVGKSSGYPLLDQSAIEAVKKWQFEPARLGSETTEGSVRVPVRFRIKRS